MKYHLQADLRQVKKDQDDSSSDDVNDEVEKEQPPPNLVGGAIHETHFRDDSRNEENQSFAVVGNHLTKGHRDREWMFASEVPGVRVSHGGGGTSGGERAEERTPV